MGKSADAQMEEVDRNRKRVAPQATVASVPDSNQTLGGSKLLALPPPTMSESPSSKQEAKRNKSTPQIPVKPKEKNPAANKQTNALLAGSQGESRLAQ